MPLAWSTMVHHGAIWQWVFHTMFIDCRLFNLLLDAYVSVNHVSVNWSFEAIWLIHSELLSLSLTLISIERS